MPKYFPPSNVSFPGGESRPTLPNTWFLGPPCASVVKALWRYTNMFIIIIIIIITMTVHPKRHLDRFIRFTWITVEQQTDKHTQTDHAICVHSIAMRRNIYDKRQLRIHIRLRPLPDLHEV